MEKTAKRRSEGKRSVAQKPKIYVNDRAIHELTDEAMWALQRSNDPPNLFIYQRHVVAIVDGRINHITPSTLRGLLDRSADFVMTQNNRVLSAKVPREVVDDIFSQIDLGSDIGLPRLTRIATSPLLLPSGNILTHNGYDSASGILMMLDSDFCIDLKIPTDSALDIILLNLLGDFPFEDSSSETHAFCLLLELVMREFIAGPTPLYLATAPIRGSGKSLLISVLLVVATGKMPAMMPFPVSDAELEKRISALLLEGSKTIVFDNSRDIKSLALSAAITSQKWSGRMLGQTKMLELDSRITWLASGNNPNISSELARRSVEIRLDPKMERPEDRTEFKHPDLINWALDNRNMILSAVFSIIKAWLEAGMPKGKNKSLGSFESWAQIMGGICEFVGLRGFLENRERLYNVGDKETAEIKTLLEMWWQIYGDNRITAKAVFEIARDKQLLLDRWAGLSELSGTQKLGHLLKDIDGGVYGGLRVFSCGSDRINKTNTYALNKIDHKPPQTT